MQLNSGTYYFHEQWCVNLETVLGFQFSLLCNDTITTKWIIRYIEIGKKSHLLVNSNGLVRTFFGGRLSVVPPSNPWDDAHVASQSDLLVALLESRRSNEGFTHTWISGLCRCPPTAAPAVVGLSIVTVIGPFSCAWTQHREEWALLTEHCEREREGS